MTREFTKRSTVASHTFRLWMGGDFDDARRAAREYCERGACLAVQPVAYVYTHGEEAGVCVTLINYPRFPSSLPDMWAQAREVAEHMARALHQGSYSVEGPDLTEFYSRREGDK